MGQAGFGRGDEGVEFEEARDALQDMCEVFSESGNEARLEGAKDRVQGDLIK